MTCEVIDDRVRQKYNKDFDSDFYLVEFFKEVYTSEKFTLTKLSQTFSNGKLTGPLRRCIDIGSGPIVHRLSAASKVCDHLVFSDYSENNRRLVEDWLQQPIPDPRHHHLFRFCAEQEGCRDTALGAREIELRVKAKVKGVLAVNILDRQPLGQTELFDVAFSGACLESACDSYQSYVSAVKNIASILRKGGYLILKGYTNGSFYCVGDTRFPCLNQNVTMVRNALAEAGYCVLEMEEVGEEHRDQTDDLTLDIDNKGYSDCTSCFFAIAQKL